MQRIDIGNHLFILPKHSLRFGGRWGKVTDIDTLGDLPIMVKFHPRDQTSYRFSQYEVLTNEDYYEWIRKSPTVLHQQTGSILNVVGTEWFPQVLTNEGIWHFSTLLPITKCQICGTDTTGQLSVICEDCEYPLPEEVNEHGNRKSHNTEG